MTAALLRRRVPALAVAVLMLVTSVPALAAPRPVRKTEPKAPAPSVLLMDARTGEVLYGRNADTRRPIASTMKIMTAIVVVEKAKLNVSVRVAASAAKVGESSMELVKGERRTVKELLYAMMLKSANDAAAALGIYVGKSLRGFVKMMNAKAAAIGARRTHFANPHGLNAPRNYSTARDLALVAAYGLRDPIFAKVVRTKSVKMPWPKHPYPRIFKNHNRLLWDFAGAIGVKTGYTEPARHCLVAAARRGPTTLVAVVLGCPTSTDAYAVTSALMRRGFARFRTEEAITQGRVYDKLSLSDLAGQEVNLVADRTVAARLYDGTDGVENVPIVSTDTTLPIERGQVLGKIEVRRHGAVLASAPLTADRDADAPTFWSGLESVWLQRLRVLSGVAEHGTVR